MKIISEPVQLTEVWENRESSFDEMMKFVVDINRQILAIDAEMHADLEQLLLENGSKQENLWGANIYPSRDLSDRLEFTSLINIRPSQGNRNMIIQDPEVRAKVIQITLHLLR